ncbi:hypothetical protein MNBD_DELTA01-1052 [hydrothermal vent metagenome]|uniref:DUF58 domain-containing protein n=1 Tax=hydrothermal vent metagenome TaxID=652676 RepID=A0A3B0QSL8_9ZZZZ
MPRIPTITAPLPWLTAAAAKAFTKNPDSKRRGVRHKLRKLQFTREGTLYTAALFILGIAAINTGNNMLYLILATLLSLIIISGIMSEPILRKISMHRQFPQRVYRATPTRVRLIITNNKRFVPSYSLNLQELPIGGVTSEPTYLVKLDSNAEASHITKYTFEKRGLTTLDGFSLKTRFPFGLFMKFKTTLCKEQVLVYPAVRSLTPGEVLQCLSSSGVSHHTVRGDGTDIYGLRDYTERDDARHIHWKASARSRRLLTKEYERESERKIVIVFDNFSPGGKDGDTAESRLKRFDEIVERTASLANHFIGKDYLVCLKTRSGEIPYSGGGDQLERILYHLALIEPASGKGVLSLKVITT